MIELYAFATPKSLKVPILLEELGAAGLKNLVRGTLHCLFDHHAPHPLMLCLRLYQRVDASQCWRWGTAQK